jgi:hypothetical protein
VENRFPAIWLMTYPSDLSGKQASSLCRHIRQDEEGNCELVGCGVPREIVVQVCDLQSTHGDAGCNLLYTMLVKAFLLLTKQAKD